MHKVVAWESYRVRYPTFRDATHVYLGWVVWSPTWDYFAFDTKPNIWTASNEAQGQTRKESVQPALIRRDVIYF